MCGLYGFIGYKKQPIDYITFLNLGIQNDDRGGDGCGVFIDGKIEYGDVKDKYFETFFKKSKLLKKNKQAQIIIGHDRKASIGGVSNDKLQPVCNKNDKGQIDFVMLHNGTIRNYKELAKKYLSMSEADCSKFTDSQLLAKIIYIHGFKVLNEYIGSAAIVVIDYRTAKHEPAVYFYKGKSKVWKNDKEETDERPLYYYRTEDGIWFSSIKTYFETMNFKNKSTIYTSPANKVVLVNHDQNEIYLTEKIDRSDKYQKEVSTFNYIPNYNYDYYYSHMYDELPFSSQTTTKSNKTDKPTQINETNVPLGPLFKITRDNMRYYEEDSKCLVDGTVYIDKDFNATYVEEEMKDIKYTVQFCNGLPIFGKDSLYDLYDYMMNEGVDYNGDIINMPEIFGLYTYFPMYDKGDNKWYFYDEWQKTPANGDVYIPNFNNKFVEVMKYTYKNGGLCASCTTSITFDEYYEQYQSLSKYVDEFGFVNREEFKLCCK